MLWIAKIQGMDWEAGCPCETGAMVGPVEGREAAEKQMTDLASQSDAIVVPNTLQGPFSVDEALKNLNEIEGRYLKLEEYLGGKK